MSVFLINGLNFCAKSGTFAHNNLRNGLMKNYTLPVIHFAPIVLPVPGFLQVSYAALTYLVPLLSF